MGQFNNHQAALIRYHTMLKGFLHWLGEDMIIPRVNEKCVEEADVILLTTPFEYALQTLKSFIPLFDENKILVDVTVPLKPFEKGKMVDMLTPEEIGAPSATELFHKELTGIPVIAAFKTLSNSTLGNIDEVPVLNQDVFVFGKNKEAKLIVKEKVELIKNLRAINSGSFKSARHVERFTAFMIGVNRRLKTHHSGFTMTGLADRSW